MAEYGAEGAHSDRGHTLLLLFMLTGSVVLPLKALVLNLLSLTASFGALVWVFQEGHLGAFGTTSTGTLVAHVPALLFCIAFGLSMDYEVFLISRIREYWLESPQGKGDNDEAVALGIARTGRVVTAAALLMVVAFATLIAAAGVDHGDVRARPDAGHSGRRDPGADAAVARADASARPVQLVGARPATSPAPTDRLQRVRCPTGCPATGTRCTGTGTARRAGHHIAGAKNIQKAVRLTDGDGSYL